MDNITHKSADSQVCRLTSQGKKPNGENAKKTQQFCNGYTLLGTGPVIEIKFDISYERYIVVQELKYHEILKIFPGLIELEKDNPSVTIKGFGKNRLRECNFGDGDKAQVILQRLLIERNKEAEEKKNNEELKFEHTFYNILPTFLITYKRYAAEIINDCYEGKRLKIVNSREEFPSVRQTYRWANQPYNPDNYSPGNGTVIVIGTDEQEYQKIILREERKKWKRLIQKH